jgi:adenylate kinase
MKLLLIGPQGSGKGTQAKLIAESLNIPHISTGDLFRNLQGELKQQVDEIINKGDLVPDELTLKILKQRFEKEDCNKGFILDGYPRNLHQAESLKQITDIDKAIEIKISDEISIRRLSSRISCKTCGAVFNLITNPPKQKNICNYCGGELYQRDDDKPEAIKKRLKTYHQETEPVLEHYKKENKLLEINGENPIKDIFKEILEELN